MFKIGPYEFSHSLVLAPMAGLTDLLFRRVCREYGADLSIGEMVASRESLRLTEMSQHRYSVDGTESVSVVQLLGSDPAEMAEAARYAVEMGAKIVDINMGCPAQIVCGKACGSALMANESGAIAILQAVREAVDVPVTVKMRTGWDCEHKNVMTLALAAQAIGLDAVTIHGRTRADRFRGEAEYETIAAVVRALSIPVIANGDIDSPKKARRVLEMTGAAAVMVGRAAQGQPWIFAEMARELGYDVKVPERNEKLDCVLRHLLAHLSYWNETEKAVRTFRKHVFWYFKRLGLDDAETRKIYALTQASTLIAGMQDCFSRVNHES